MAITRITKGVIKPNENYDTHNIVSTGIVTSVGLDVNGNADISGSLSVGGVLTYEDVTSIDSVGIITARSGLVSPNADIDDFVSVGNNIHLGNAGVITATSFVGSGAALTGIDATAIKDSGGNVKIQAQASGAIHSGVSTFQDIDVDGHTNLDNVSIAGVTTTTEDIIIGADNKKLKLGAGEELQLYQAGNHSVIQHNGGHYLQLRSNSFIIMDAAATKTIFFGDPNGQSALYFNGSKKLNTLNGGVDITGSLQVDSLHCLGQINLDSDIDVEGHTNLDNLSIAGVTTTTGSVNVGGYVVSQGTSGKGGIFGQIEVGYDSTYLTVQPTSGHNDLHLNYDNGSTVQIGHTNGSTLTVNGNILPKTDSASDLGLTGKRFRAAYVDTYYGDGSNLTGITAGLSNIVEDSSPQLGGNLDTNGKLINFGDSSGGTVNRLQFGDGEELKLFHGSNGNSYFQSTVGGTFIRVAGSNEIALQSEGGSENMIRAIGNGAVELYHNNTKRIETTANGVLCLRYAFDTDNYITCNNTANTMEFVLNNTDIGEFSGSGLLIRDSMQLRVGTGNDTRFYHSGTHSYIKHAGTGNFYIDIGNDDLFAITMAESEHLANFTGNGAVELFHNGSKKFETLSYGVQIHGALTASNNINFGDNTSKFMSGSANQLQMYYDGSNAYINNTVATQLKFATNNTVRCQVQSDGHFAPVANNTYDLGTSSMRWRNVYVDDLQLSNEGSKNDVDGTWGDWTLQEGEDKVFMINNRTGKRYSLKMEEE